MPSGAPTAPAPAAASRLLLAVDVFLASRALYGFLKSYFRWRLERQAARERQAAAVREQREQQSRRPVRIYLDGCFDLMHYGHANAIRQAASLGDELVVGVCSDAEITCHKGPPVMAEEERYEAVEAVKWVDQVIRGVPYLVTAEFLDKLVREYHIDYVVHGDDPCIGADGRDVYDAVKRADKFRTIARTEGVSSTDIVGRMLLCTTSHHLPRPSSMDGEMANRHQRVENKSASPDGHVTPDAGERTSRVNRSTDTAVPAYISPRTSSFLPTTRRLMQFSSGRKPQPGDRVVYADGAWDMFTVAHIRLLKRCRELGDFVLVGVHDDYTVNQHRGRNYPILNLHERALSVLSCRHVDEVILGAPWKVTEDMIRTMSISLVVHGTHYDELSVNAPADDPYEVPRRLGIYREVESASDLSVPRIIERIVANRDRFVEKQRRKSAQEQAYYQNKEHIEEL